MRKLICLFATAAALHAAVKLPALISDHMVLQQGMPVRVWGTADPGESVSVNFQGQTVSAKAAENGRWTAWLRPLVAAGPLDMTINSRTIHDVLVGEVWLGSGQSNMEFAVRASTNAMGATYGAGNERMRYLNIQKHSAGTPQDEFTGPVQWTALTPETVNDASAVCYYMARSLQASYQIPVGFINASWGGTTIQGWIGAESLRTLDD